MNIWRLKLDVNMYGYRYLDIDEEYAKMIIRCNRIEEKKHLMYTLDFEWKGNNYADVYGFGNIKGVFAVTKKTKEILQEHNNLNIEFIKITSKESAEELYLVHILSAADVLDLENCEYSFIMNKFVDYIYKFSFKPTVKEYSLFKCVANGFLSTSYLYCTDTFKNIIDENNITGFLFEKIYEIQ